MCDWFESTQLLLVIFVRFKSVELKGDMNCSGPTDLLGRLQSFTHIQLKP